MFLRQCRILQQIAFLQETHVTVAMLSFTCSDKFILTTVCPENLPMAAIKLVFPTPGLPSISTKRKKTFKCKKIAGTLKKGNKVKITASIPKRKGMS